MKEIDNISVKDIPNALKRAGFGESDHVRISVERVETDAQALALAAEKSGAFDFWHDEPDLYSEKNVKEWYG